MKWKIARRLLSCACAVSFAATTLFAQTIKVSNLDGRPYPNRLVFNRIGTNSSPPPNGVHDRGTVRLRNRGASDLTITMLTLDGRDGSDWLIESAPPIPFTILPGSTADVTLRFAAESRQRIHVAKLSISSNDPKKPTFTVQLRGYWQELSDDLDEPSLLQILNMFGYKTVLAYDGEDFFTQGKRTATGDEIFSPFWRQADVALPVTVQQLVAFHTYPAGHAIDWHYVGSSERTPIFTHEAEDAQSLLPRKNGTGSLAKGSFTPSASIAGGAFGFVVEGTQWSDPSMNDASSDDCSGGPETCGQHIRFWPAKKRNGSVIPNTYIMAMDFADVSYDYQDNVYLVSNITPFILERPFVTDTSPEDGAVDVSRDTFIAVDVLLPNVGQGIDANTLTSTSVKLYPSGAPEDLVPANLNTSGGGDAIVLQPTVLLAANTPYVFEITEELKDLAGTAFIPHKISFATGPVPTGPATSTIEFEKVALTGTSGKFTSLTIGPDGKLYASQQNGLIRRWTINPDGTLSNGESLDALRLAEGGNRLLIGLVFDPAAAATNLVAWVTHTTYGFSGMPEWGSKITMLSGPNLEIVKDYVVDLPRSIRDHVTNSLAFGPDGALYVSQGSNTAMGAPDKTWGNRPERKLTAAVLRVDVAALNALAVLPLNVRTDNGTYDPYAPGAPVKVFASGIRNAYDLVWHSNGSLYVPTNGSAANGKAPASVNGTIRLDGQPYNGPVVPAIDSVETQNDFLFLMSPPSGGTWGHQYYGHPNPTRGEYALNGGNPTELTDLAQVSRYPVGVHPDAAWKGIAFNFGRNISPNGIIEYRSTMLDGALTGKLLVTRYSGGDDIIVLTPDATTGHIPMNGDLVGITGFTQFADPIDLTENVANGNIYVSEYGGNGRITLLRPVDPNSNEAPLAAFTATPTSGTVPLAVSFDASGSTDSDGFITSYNWDFDGDGVIDLTSPLATGAEYTYTAAGSYNATLIVTDDDSASGVASQLITVSDPILLAAAESDGLVTIEAEHFDANAARGGQSWTLKDLGGAVGGTMRPEPVLTTNIDLEYATMSPEMQYHVQFSTTGTYFVWVRAYAEGGDSDSWHVGLDSQPIATADRMTMGPKFLSFRWINKTMDGEPATLQIDSVGVHVVNVWMREDGVFLDRLLMTTDADYVPSGDGPPESPRTDVPDTAVAFGALNDAIIRGSDGMIVDHAAIPDQFELLGNYPNPFNSLTTIEYSLPEEAHVTLEVFDLFGRRVDLLIDRLQQPGFHRAAYNAADLASGVYMYRLTAGSFSRTSTMILSK